MRCHEHSMNKVSWSLRWLLEFLRVRRNKQNYSSQTDWQIKRDATRTAGSLPGRRTVSKTRRINSLKGNAADYGTARSPVRSVPLSSCPNIFGCAALAKISGGL